MPEEPAGAGRSAGGSESGVEGVEGRFDYAHSNRSLAATLGGTCVAILTFALFFLYNGVLAGAFDSFLFRVTVAAIVVCMFLFVYSATFYYRAMESLSRNHARSRRHVRTADTFFVLGLILITLEPALILFTARLADVGSVALVLWVLTVAFLALGRGEFR